MPGVPEKHTQMRSNPEQGVKPMGLLADFSKAHRRVKVLESEWGMLACKLRGDTTWVNRGGTFGISSAAYWWARTAGCILRCVYGLLGPSWPLELLLFADDVDMEAEDEKERTAVVLSSSC